MSVNLKIVCGFIFGDKGKYGVVSTLSKIILHKYTSLIEAKILTNLI